MLQAVVIMFVAFGAVVGAGLQVPAASANTCRVHGRDMPPAYGDSYYDAIYVKRHHHLICHAAANVAHHLDYDYYDGDVGQGDHRVYDTQWGTFDCVVLDRGSDFLDGRCKGPKHRSVRWYSNKTIR